MSSATADLPPPPQGWPAPYAEGRGNPWVRQMMMALPVALAVLDGRGRLLGANEAMRATAGPITPGMAPSALVVPDDAWQVEAGLKRLTATQETVSLRVALANRPQEVQAMALIAVPPGLGGAALIAMRDIREQLRLEAQVATAARMQAVGQLAGGVAHDFNNLLTAMLALTDELLERHRAGDDHAALGQIRRNGERGAALVGQLLAFARQQPQRQQLLDLVPLVEGLRPLLGQLLGPAVELVIEAPPLPWTVSADPGQIEQVIVNLAINARDAMAGNGRLTIRLFAVPAAAIDGLGHGIIPHVDHVGLSVIDTGPGVPAAIAGRIFEPFFTTKPLGQGTGLGLSTVYGIVKQSNGFVFAGEGPGGRGAAFSIYLPARPLARTQPVPPPAPDAAPARLAGLALLLVEDDAAVRTVFARGLERQGLAVTAVGDAMAALALLKEGMPCDLLVSDVMMPGIDGVELAGQARRLRPGLGILLVSGHADLPLRQALVAQDVRFLTKPFALAELVHTLAEIHVHR